MLDTLLHIGKTFRDEGYIQQHRYIKHVIVSSKINNTKYYSLLVKEDFSFDFDGIKEIPENERSGLFYLSYQTSDSDTSIKTLFGDIYRFKKKNGKEGGNYRSLSVSGYSSVDRADEHAVILKSRFVQLFRKSLHKNLKYIEDVLDRENNVFLHFDFNGINWYELDDGLLLDEISDLMVSKFATMCSKNGRWAFNSMLYRSICSGDDKNDIQFPCFDKRKKYRSAGFTKDDIKNLFYAINYSEKALITERDIKIIVLPKGDNITSENLIAFSENRIKDNGLVQLGVDINKYEELFTSFLHNTDINIVEFDVVFCKTGGQVDSDVIEYASIQKSFLEERLNEINRIKSIVHKSRDEEGLCEKITLTIRRSLYNILSDKSTAKKKYQNHIFKVLPQIYIGAYCCDDVLLPAFIQKIEYNIRNSQENYNYLKYDYYFLTKIQNTEVDKIMEMQNSFSYKAGNLLGKMAKPLSYKINSFEKNYVGLLSRRISDKKGLICLSNFINEKLAIHDIAYPDLKTASVEFASIVNMMSDKDYFKNECAFGFFESYFKYEPKITDKTEL